MSMAPRIAQFPRSRRTRQLAPALREVLAAELGPEPRIEELCGELLRVRGFSWSLATALLEAATGRAGESWEERRLAVLMLQLQLLRSLQSRRERLDLDLGLDLPPAAELRRRLLPTKRAAAGLRGAATTPAAWRGFLAAARHECRLPLARHAFTPAEVVVRVRAQVRVSRGVRDPLPDRPADAALESRRLLRDLPPYEAEICRRLIQDAAIYWVDARTRSEMGALVEQPPGTVVLVVRPPGSDLEIELKRAGRRGPHPLSAVHSRDGRDVPPSHRLDGGSMGPLLQWEARNSARLARAYRRVHGEEAAVSLTLAIATVYTLPGATGEAHLLDYFTDPAAFGPGFATMRRELRRVLAAARREGATSGLGLPGDLGETLELVNWASPRQAVMVGTSALRLDRAARYLAHGGAVEYFAEYLAEAPRREPAPGEARRWADDLLADVLGEPVFPSLPDLAHGAYVEAVLAANRRRADRLFLRLARQLGRLWATVAALGAGSWGESFVARNVGLACRWRDGRRRVELVSMDHDRLTFPDAGEGDLQLATARALDERYVLGEHGRVEVTGSFEHLAAIYRVDEDLVRRGREALLAELPRARRRVCDAGLTPRRPLSHPPFRIAERR
ncbi:MAG TPA: hypothetical protein VIE43_26555 [Thermoanaerobaculia bacterium]|jgi:hypothetical protein|nr:hypothetical protein [Thermoanaerobaculia bacterium]